MRSKQNKYPSLSFIIIIYLCESFTVQCFGANHNMPADCKSRFYHNMLTLITAWICYLIPSKVWDEITDPTVEVCEWISYLVPRIIIDVIT